MKNALIYLVVYIALQAGVAPIVKQLFKLMGDAEPKASATLLIGMAVANIIALAVFLLARWARVSRAYVQSRQWGVLAWCAVAAVGMVIPSTGLQELMPKMPNLLEKEMMEIMKSQWGYLAVVLLAPVVEELVFRGAILRSLIDKWPFRPGIAIIVSALIFSFCHGNRADAPRIHSRTAAGVDVLAHGQCGAGVAFHWVNNTIAFILCNVMPNPDAPLIEIFGGSKLHVALAVVFSLCILLPALYQLNLRMKRRRRIGQGMKSRRGYDDEDGCGGAAVVQVWRQQTDCRYVHAQRRTVVVHRGGGRARTRQTEETTVSAAVAA